MHMSGALSKALSNPRIGVRVSPYTDRGILDRITFPGGTCMFSETKA